MGERRKIVYSFLLWRLLLFLLIFVAPFFFTLQTILLGAKPMVIKAHPLLWVHGNFDGEHYISIAQKGYQLAEQAFFPLYPHLIDSLSPLFIANYTLSGLVISNISFFLALILLIKLIRLDFSPRTSFLVLFLLLVFPTSFFFGAVYSESLFFLLLISSFYLARTNRWWLAGIVGSLATATRFVGIFIFPSLLAELWLQNKFQDLKDLKKIIPKIFPILIVPAGLLFYMKFLDQSTGDPLIFFHSLPAYGNFRSEKIVLLYQVFWRYLKMIFTVTRNDHIYWTILLEAVTGLLFLFTSIMSFKITRLSYAVFNLAAYLVPTLTGSFVSLPRYVLICFPSFIVIAYLLGKWPKVQKIYFFISTISLIYFWMKFTQGYWVG